MAATVRAATGGDADDVERLLDAAMLEFDRAEVGARIDAGNAFVAVVEDESGGERVVGACVFDDSDDDGDVDAGGEPDPDTPATEIEHVAVHRSRRGRGIGRDLVDAVDERTDGTLIARFHESVRPFYESLGFEIRPHTKSDARLLGTRS